jgi:hypothetical protein
VLLDSVVAEHEQLARLLKTVPDSEWPSRMSPVARHHGIIHAQRLGEHADEHATKIEAATNGG